jgi:hypothetical protein
MSHPTDFIDDDLSGRTLGPDGLIDPLATRRKAQTDMDRMSKQRERLEDQVASTTQELERLRQKQENLQEQKKTLEDIRRQQGDYLREKKDIGQRLHQSLVLLEKEEIRVSQLAELYADSRETFGRMAEKLEALGEGNWEESRFDEEMTKALDQVKAMRMEFNKTLARLDAFGWPSEEGEAATETTGARDFRDWLLMGLALGLPISLLLSLSAILVYFTLTKWLSF